MSLCALPRMRPQGPGVQFFPPQPAVGQEPLEELPEARAVAFDLDVTQLVHDHVLEAVEGHRHKPKVQGHPSTR